jgi:hypothetical protein
MPGLFQFSQTWRPLLALAMVGMVKVLPAIVEPSIAASIALCGVWRTIQRMA